MHYERMQKMNGFLFFLINEKLLKYEIIIQIYFLYRYIFFQINYIYLYIIG